MAITCVESVSVKHQFDRPRLKNMGFSGDSDGKEYACNAGDVGLISRSGRSLEKRMATHSSILAWRIPWIEEAGGLQSTVSQRVERN